MLEFINSRSGRDNCPSEKTEDGVNEKHVKRIVPRGV